MDGRVLTEAGLTEKEAEVYLALVELGSSSATHVIQKTGLHRAVVYDLLERLIEKGLVGHVIQGRKRFFEATSPNRLMGILKEKEEKIQTILPHLLELSQFKEHLDIRIYKGKEGIKSIFEDILIEKRPWFVFGATGKFKELFHAYFIHFHNRRARLKIPLKIIFDERIKSEKREKELTYSKIRYLPKHYIKPSTTFIYSDKVTIIIWSPEPMAFLIRSKNVADSYRDFFDILWKSAKM